MADYLDIRRIRALAGDLGLRPSKGRGQNFLFDANTVRRIVSLAQVGPGDTVLEIGPGLGSLTAGLLHAGARVVAVEIEPALARRLPQTMAELAPEHIANLTVVEADALRLGEYDSAPSENADSQTSGDISHLRSRNTRTVPVFHASHVSHLVSNLPYNIAVPVILHLLATLPTIRRGLVMVQLEVADRLVAPPGSKVYGVPSAKLAWYASATRAGVVPPTVFWPAPRVESGLVAFTRREPPAGADRTQTFRLVDLAFSQRRKMLRSLLIPKYGPGATAALESAGIDPAVRGETLSIADFARLALTLSGLSE